MDEQVRIKKTKSVEMSGNRVGIWMLIGEQQEIFIPVKAIFQVKRGLESYIQRFYRKRRK